MIGRADVEKLLSVRAADSAVLSLYLAVPADPAALRGLPAKVDALIAAAAGRADELSALAGVDGDPALARERETDRRAARKLVEAHSRNWLGHTVAIFICGRLGLLEEMRLPPWIPERAVLATRPHVRPLLVAMQRFPAYRVAVIDRRHAWIFKVSRDHVELAAQEEAEGVRSPGFGGWYGLQAHRVQQRLIGLAHHHYRDTTAILAQALRVNEGELLVLGGHQYSFDQFLAELPADVRARHVGGFTADPHTLTPAHVRELADPVIARSMAARERLLAAQIRQAPPNGLVAVGLRECVTAANQNAIRLLVAPDDGLVPGFVCERCGALATTESGCPDWGTAAEPVPDLIEEMVVRTLTDEGRVEAVGNPPGGVAALLRFAPAPS